MIEMWYILMFVFKDILLATFLIIPIITVIISGSMATSQIN